MLPVCACDGKLGSRHRGRALRRRMERAAEIRIAIFSALLQIVVDDLRVLWIRAALLREPISVENLIDLTLLLKSGCKCCSCVFHTVIAASCSSNGLGRTGLSEFPVQF
jgi:hypothetical protein